MDDFTVHILQKYVEAHKKALSVASTERTHFPVGKEFKAQVWARHFADPHTAFCIQDDFLRGVVCVEEKHDLF